jgi:hypothetical protein
MGMPIIEGSNTTKTQALTDILVSISLEEAAIAHILNAEGEKLQNIIANEQSTNQDLLHVNQSVDNLADNLTNLVMLLKSKTRLALHDKCYANYCISCSDYQLDLESNDGTIIEIPPDTIEDLPIPVSEGYVFITNNILSNSMLQVKTIPNSNVELTTLLFGGDINVNIHPEDTFVISYLPEFRFGGIIARVDFADHCTRNIVILITDFFPGFGLVRSGTIGNFDPLTNIKDLKWTH